MKMLSEGNSFLLAGNISFDLGHAELVSSSIKNVTMFGYFFLGSDFSSLKVKWCKSLTSSVTDEVLSSK